MNINLSGKKTLMFLIALWLAAIMSTPVFAKQITLEDLVREVKVALLKVEQHAANANLPPFSTAELELNTVQSAGLNGKISFLIVEIGGAGSEQITNSVRLTLLPPPPKSSSDVANLKFADSLAESIIAGAQAIAVAKKGSPPLKAKELQVSVKFVIIRDAEGKLSIKYPPFEIAGGGSVSDSAIQSITVRYSYE